MFTVTNLIFLSVQITLLTVAAVLALKASRDWSLVGLHHDCRGVSYTLTMILILPFYLAMVIGAIELNWMFHADTLFQRASLMTGRSIALTYQQTFEKHENESERFKELEQTGELAATLVMVSAGSGLPEHAVELTKKENDLVKKYIAHLGKTSGMTPNEDTKRRAKYAAGAATVQLEAIEENEEVSSSYDNNAIVDRAQVTLEYEHPFFSQAIGKVLGRLSSKSETFYVWKFSKEFEIPLEIARSEDQTMGIIHKEN